MYDIISFCGRRPTYEWCVGTIPGEKSTRRILNLKNLQQRLGSTICGCERKVKKYHISENGVGMDWILVEILREEETTKISGEGACGGGLPLESYQD